MNSELATTLEQLPDNPGIYEFFDAQGELIYVGKATSLASRVRSYFRGQRTPRPIEEMIHEVVSIKTQSTESVLEAVILEAVYIKKFLPKYNVLGKDNKSWNYLVLTKEPFPRLKTLRDHEMRQLTARERKALYREEFGPFPGLNAGMTMKILRRLFFVSSCTPDAKRPCLYRQMGQCLGVCTGEISKAEYERRVVRPLSLFLRGQKKHVIRSFQARMKIAAKQQDFEEAARLRDQLSGLSAIHDVALLNESFVKDIGFLRSGEGVAARRVRIEGYDISNLGATDKVGSMVVFDETGPIKSAYRKFTIKTVVGQSDVDCLKEVLGRRLRHAEWPLPTIFLIDGGRPQINAALEVIRGRGVAVPVVGIAKGSQRKRNDIILGEPSIEHAQLIQGYQALLIRVRDEAHRFAITFNRSKRRLKK